MVTSMLTCVTSEIDQKGQSLNANIFKIKQLLSIFFLDKHRINSLFIIIYIENFALSRLRGRRPLLSHLPLLLRGHQVHKLNH